MFIFDNEKFTNTIVHHLKGVSCRDAAEMCHVSAATISRLQNGSKPSSDTLINICMGLWLDPRTFYNRAGGVSENQMRLL